MKSWRMVSWHIWKLTAVCSGRERCFCISITGCCFKHKDHSNTNSPCYQHPCAGSSSWLSSLCLVWQQGQWYQKAWPFMLCLLSSLNCSSFLSLCWSVPLMLSSGPGPTDGFISLEMFWGVTVWLVWRLALLIFPTMGSTVLLTGAICPDTSYMNAYTHTLDFCWRWWKMTVLAKILKICVWLWFTLLFMHTDLYEYIINNTNII